MPFFPKKKSAFESSLKKRIVADDLTHLRLKYDLWYKSFDRQEGNKVWLDGRELLMLSSNDYLGLGYDPRVMQAAQEALAEWGTSPTGSRISNGSRHYHQALEEQLADFLGTEACHIHSAGYLSCMAAAATFVSKGDVILVDRNVHSSLWDGIRLSMATIEKFFHNNPADLREALSHVDGHRKKMLVIEGVYSMEGHVSPLEELVEIAREHDCFILLDDAHGLGVMGEKGQGTAHHFGVEDQIDVISGSLSKSLASTGGFIAADRSIVEYLRTYSKQTIFSAALSPSQAAVAAKALEIHQREPEHFERLWKNTRRYVNFLQSQNLDFWQSETPAVPILVGSKEKAYFFQKRLVDKGVYANLVIPPAVPPGKDLIRTAISASFTEEDMERIEDAIAHAAKAVC